MISFLRISNNISSLEASCCINNINVFRGKCLYIPTVRRLPISEVCILGGNHLFSSVSEDDLEVTGAYYISMCVTGLLMFRAKPSVLVSLLCSAII